MSSGSRPSDALPEAAAPHVDLFGEAEAFPVFFYRRRQRVLASVLDAVLDIGRQREGEPPPAARRDDPRGARIIVAPIDDVEVSRSHVELRRAPGGQVEVVNRSRTLTVELGPGETLAPGERRVTTPPTLIQFGDYAIRVDPPEAEDELQLEGLPQQMAPPGRQTDPAALTRLSDAVFDESSLLRWLETVLGVFQSAANSRDFPEQAAFAVTKIVGLDAAAMLRCGDDGRWRVEALHANAPEAGRDAWRPSQTLLARVRRERRTFRHVPTTGAGTAASLVGVSALVAAPILDGEGRVIGALYGDRRSGRNGPGRGRHLEITAFEAKLVELLASGIAGGLARLKEEQAAIAARVRFEQFFTSQLAAQLERDPRLLEGRNAEVTILFADIRGFSSASERLGPAGTMAWIQDTMGTLSQCVLAHQGVLVDYIGDELMAMWGAPIPQAEHARLACFAARDMLAALAEVNGRWRGKLGAEVKLGIGLNSGVARVGNTGSALKFKYGPLGDVVNVASRVQGATKYLGADCLITGETLTHLPAGVAARRLARVRVVNIEHPVDLHEIVVEPPADWERLCQRYRLALEALERDELDAAARGVEQLVRDYPGDRAVQALARRVAQARTPAARGDTGVWDLPGK